MSRHTLTYNGIDLSTYGAYVSGEGAWAKPAPEFEHVSVPGRSGDVLLYNGRYSNVDITYTLGIISDFDTNYNALIACLMSSPGYHKLVDSSHPGVYRMAAIDVGIEPKMTQFNRRGQFKVTFNCKPQVYLDSGDTWQILAKNGSKVDSGGSAYKATNDTDFATRPILRVTGYGDVKLNGNFYEDSPGVSTSFLFTILQHPNSDEIRIDFETGDAVDEDGNNMNDKVIPYNTIIMPAFEPVPIAAHGNVRWSTMENPNSSLGTVYIKLRNWRL